MNDSPNQEKSSEIIRYVPIGDSYTMGTGVEPDQAWPVLLTEHLKREGINIILKANPAVAGWTSQAAIEGEVPYLDIEGANFSTLLIGANDLVNGFSVSIFRRRMQHLLDAMLEVLEPNRLLVITIPDFTVTPRGADFRLIGNAGQIEAFNAIIKEEAAKRDVRVVDLFPSSQLMIGPDVAADGLHPSALGHRKWEELIFSVAYDLLSAAKSITKAPRTK